MSQETAFFPLGGGLDLVTPAIVTPAGRAIGGMNYEPAPNGYQRCDGYERFDGRPKPSEASYWKLGFDAGTAAIAEGATVTGATSGATGKALVNGVVESGSYGGSNAAGYLVLTAVSGTFQNNEALQVGGVTKCTADGTALSRSAGNDDDDATWLRDAIETARALITAVPGSGAIRGVWVYEGDVYAFRDNVGASACVMHKATTAGWTAQNLGRSIAFTSGGTTEIVAGNTITGATSGATATVARIFKTSGTWAGGDAAGRMILSGQTGTFQAENLNVGASLNVGTIGGNSTAITLPAGGRYDFVNHNFYGASNLRRMYGCNGVGTAFEWNGTVFVPIVTGMSSDVPAHITVHKNHLFLSFAGGSIQHSGTGDPMAWSILSGAAEIGLGEDVTGFLRDLSGVLAILGRNKVAILYGNDSTDWSLSFLAEDAGAIEWTAQKLGTAIYLDDAGLRDMRTTNAFGDFRMGTLSALVDPWLRAKRAAGVRPVASLRVRAKDSYRLYYADGSGLVVYVGKKAPEILPFDLGITVSATCSAEDADGDEILFAGSDAGMVYQLDAGTSFDGTATGAFLRLPFNHVGRPTQIKRWHKATLELDGTEAVNIGVLAEFSYADADQPPSQMLSFDVSGGGGFWGEADWNDFYWSSPVKGRAAAHIDGIGENMSIAIVSTATYEAPHTLHGITLHYSLRGLKR